MLKDYNNWCPEIYRGLFIDRINDDQIRLAPCCQSQPTVESIDQFDFKTSPHLTKLRQQFTNGERPVACNNCWIAENAGHKSRRQSAIEFYNISAPNEHVVLEGLDHNVTWTCNLACVMCGPECSSFWASEENLNKQQIWQLGRRYQKSNTFFEKIDVQNLRKIHFNGGEPLLGNEHTNFLEKLEEQNILKNLFISYNTNGTVMPTKKIIELWKKTHLVKLFFSIDATESAYEYIRWPGKWQETSTNIINMKANLPDNVMFGINVTVGSYNIFEVLDVYQWFEKNLKQNKQGDQSDFCWQLTNKFELKYLPNIIKLQAIDQLQSIVALGGIVNYLKAHTTHTENLSWMSRFSDLDAKRNTNWKSALKISQFIEDANC